LLFVHERHARLTGRAGIFTKKEMHEVLRVIGVSCPFVWFVENPKPDEFPSFSN